MARTKTRNYVGASGTITPEKLTKLGPAYMVQPKMDGAYCSVHLGPTGCIARISSRSGADFGPGMTDTLIGQFVGYPGAVMAGELTGHTEAGNAEAESFGARRVHVFDLLFGNNSEPITQLPYSQRRKYLFEMQVKVDTYGPGQTWRQTPEGVRDKRTGWFTAKTHTGTALTPIVPQVAPQAASELWDRVQSGELEGLVAVAQNAPAGRRGAKRKCKPVDTLDVVAIHVGPRAVECLYLGKRFIVSKASRDICVGDMLELKHNGWYRDGIPRFARIVRRRDDLVL